MTNAASLYGLILNGGTSSRMGTPKGELNFHGKPQQQYLYDLLTALCTAVYISVKKNSKSNPLPQIVDQFSIETPLNGIFSALKFSSISGWLVVANDMPNLDKEALEHLISQRDPSMVATCYYDSSGKRPEPLVSIWEAAAQPLLEKFIEKGGVSPRAFLESHSIKLISVQNKETLLNINSQEELLRFRDQKSK